MKLLKHLIEKADDTLDEIEFYAENAIHYKTEHKALADTYNKVADMHVGIYDMLHRQMVEIIEEQRRAGDNPPKSMLEIWEYEHKRLIKEFAEAKSMVEEYKKSY